jgi:hypothetical protein
LNSKVNVHIQKREPQVQLPQDLDLETTGLDPLSSRARLYPVPVNAEVEVLESWGGD